MLRFLPIFVVCLASLLQIGRAEIHGVRLRGGSTPGQGKVEVKRGPQWGAVCDDHWTIVEANVVCNQLGYTHAVSAPKKSEYGEARGPIWIKGVTCTGQEAELSSCTYSEISTNRKTLYENTDEIHECQYGRQAGVVCAEKPNSYKNMIRLGEEILSSGPSKQKSRLVTVEEGGHWRPICSNTWTSKEAIVACRQAGLGFAKLTEKIVKSNLIDTFSSVVTSVRCNGDEASLHECGMTDADHCNGDEYYGSVICSETAPDISVNITYLGESIKIRWRNESKMICAREEGCMSKVGLEKTPEELNMSTSQRKLLIFSSVVQNFGNDDFRPPQVEGGWHYHQCHRHIHSITDFAKYELRDLSSNVVAVGHKVSFCLRDNICVNWKHKKYRCSKNSTDGNQGISIGCADLYLNGLDCQWIDVTEVAKGKYTLEINSNPNLLVAEQDFSNNLLRCDIRITNKKAYGSNCHYPADFEDYVPVTGR